MGACEQQIFIENRGFRTDILQNFPSFLTKTAVKFELMELKIVIFSKTCLLWRGNVTFLSNEGLVNRLVPQLGVL